METGPYLRLAPYNESPHMGSSSVNNSPPIGSLSPSDYPSRRVRSYSGSQDSPPRIRRRNRLITSCLECRRRKLKCDKGHPCGNCTKFVRDCVFLAPSLDPAAQMKLAEIKEKMGSLERTLEEDIARGALGDKSRRLHRRSTSGGSSDDDFSGPEDEQNLKATPLAFEDAAYYEDADDDMMDLGIQVGKMRLTERLGGLVRPKLAIELSQIMGERSSHIKTELKDLENTASGLGIATSIETGRPKIKLESIGPSKDFTVPSSNFFFPEQSRKASVMQFLPAKPVADILLNRYWDAVHYVARVVHKPTTMRQWDQFWVCIQSGIEPPASFQALVMGILMSAIISMSEETVAFEFGAVKVQLLDSFRQGTELALSRANFLRSTKLQTLQALVMYLVALCRREVSRAHSALCGAAIRLAECMGLHRDGSRYGLDPVEIHVRRIIWYQLCFLDIRTCEATGPRPQIHREDFDTRLPLNVDDIDLESMNPPTKDSLEWTDMTCTLMRFECSEMHRYIWRERPRIEDKSTTLTAVLGKVQAFVLDTERKYMPMLNKDVALHYMTMLIYRLLTFRMYVMILHQYATAPGKPMPDRLRKILLSSGVQQVECAIIIETSPAVAKWSWVLGALHQYHAAIVLLTELYASPEQYFEDRIWNCLDFVFELPGDLTRREKARHIFEEIVQKSEYFHSLRRVRAPKKLEDGLAAHFKEQREQKMREQQQQFEQHQHQQHQHHQHQQHHQHHPQHHHLQQHHQHHESTASATSDPNSQHPRYRQDALPSMEFRNLSFVPDMQYYASTADRNSHSPQGHSVRSRMPPLGGDLLHNNVVKTTVDIDWNELDRIFPPSVDLTDKRPTDFTYDHSAFTRGFSNTSAPLIPRSGHGGSGGAAASGGAVGGSGVGGGGGNGGGAGAAGGGGAGVGAAAGQGQAGGQS